MKHDDMIHRFTERGESTLTIEGLIKQRDEARDRNKILVRAIQRMRGVEERPDPRHLGAPIETISKTIIN